MIKIYHILTDFNKNATPRLNNKVMNLRELYNSIIVVHPLKISLSSDKFNVLKTSSIEDRGHLFSKTIGISRFSVVSSAKMSLIT